MKPVYVFVTADIFSEEPLCSRFMCNEILILILREREDAIIDHLNASFELLHPINRATFFSYRQMRIGESAGVEQIRRERGVLGFFRFAVDVGIAEQAFPCPLAIPDIESR